MEHYVIRIEGALPADALVGISGLSVTPMTMQTELHGDLPDQSALAGVLDRLDELSVVILEVLKLPDDPDAGRRDA
jgi:hypothetical protein